MGRLFSRPAAIAAAGWTAIMLPRIDVGDIKPDRKTTNPQK
jgi:hypothetical protein